MENKQIKLTERIKSMYRFAVQKGFVNSKTEFAEFLGITPQTFSRFLNGAKEPPANTLRKFNAKFGGAFSEEWLLLGRGEMLAANADETPTPMAKPEPKEQPFGDQPISSAFAMLITEMRESRIAKDEQIERLLTIIENIQKGN